MEQVISSKTIVSDELHASGDEEKVHVYGSTRLTSPKRPKSRQKEQDDKFGQDRAETTSATSHLFSSSVTSSKTRSHSDDAYVVSTSSFRDSSSWLSHPKIRENYKVVIGAILLTIIGSVMFLVGVGIVISPNRGFHCLVFFIGGLLCLIPGAYHVVYIYLALKGYEGYSLYDLPVFN